MNLYFDYPNRLEEGIGAGHRLALKMLFNIDIKY